MIHETIWTLLAWDVLSCSRLASSPDSIAAILRKQCALWNDLEAMTHIYRNLLQSRRLLAAPADDPA